MWLLGGDRAAPAARRTTAAARHVPYCVYMSYLHTYTYFLMLHLIAIQFEWRCGVFRFPMTRGMTQWDIILSGGASSLYFHKITAFIHDNLM